MKKLQTYCWLFVLITAFISKESSAQISDNTRKGYFRAQLGLIFKKTFDIRNGFSRLNYAFSHKNSDSLILPRQCSTYKRSFVDSFNTFQDSIWQKGQPWGKYHPSFLHQYYGDSEVYVKNGVLHLLNSRRKKTFYSNSNDSISIPYGTGLINTFNSKSFQYGYFAIRSKNPKGPATWPAFWLTGRYHWPPEIDIFEMYGKAKGKSIHEQTMTLHFGKTEHRTKRLLEKDVQLPRNTDSMYHIYACLWEPKKITFYTDGVKIKTIKLNKWMQQFFQEPMYVILNNAIDHNYLPSLNNAPMPQDFQVDWIQVYQK